MMQESSTPYFQSPKAYASYLEGLSDAQFLRHASDLASMPLTTSGAQTLDMSTSLAPQSEQSEASSCVTCITCELRNGHTVLPLALIREILPVSQHITRLPEVPHWMLGILSWRSQTMATIDLCSYLRKQSDAPLRDHVTLIVQYEQTCLALRVLSIDLVPTTIDIRRIVPLAPNLQYSKVVVGVLEQDNLEQGQVYVLDIPVFFNDVVQSIERRES